MTQSLAPRLLGAKVKRVEDPRFLLGKARYIDDLVRPGMLHAAFLRTPIPHGYVRSVDVGPALAMEGVRAALTGRDIAEKVKPIVCDSTFEGFRSSDHHAMALDKVRYVGEALAIVAADSRYLAEDAVELIEFDIDELEAVASIAAATREGAPLLHEQWGDNYFIEDLMEAGDVEAAFRDAHGVFEINTSNQRHSGIPLETRGVIAEFDSDGVLTMWSATQIPHMVRTGMADCLEIPEHKIRVIAPDVGGGFGPKAHLFPEELAVCQLAIETGRPIKWIEDRREHMLSTFHAREHYHRLKVAYTDDGVVTALDATIEVDCGAYSIYPWTAAMDVEMGLVMLPGPYKIRNFRCDAQSVATNKCPFGAYRGVARTAVCFSIERVMDQVAKNLDMDPVEVRRRNLIRSDEFPYMSITGMEYDSGSLIESLDKVCDEADYQGMRKLQAEARSEGRMVGIGVAVFTEQTAPPADKGLPLNFSWDAATVRMDPSGKVVVQVGTHSHGQGHETTLAQIVADELSLPLADVRIAFGDTESTPNGIGTFASRSAVVAGSASYLAASSVKENLRARAAHLLEASVDDIEVGAGRLSIKGAPQQGMSIAEVARISYHHPEMLDPSMEPLLEAVATYNAGPGTYANSAQIALVEVDAETGRFKILRYLVVEDCGQMINPTIVDGQVHGGIAQGLGGALFEELIYDEGGQLLTTTFLDYLMPGATDIPNIEVSHLVTPSAFVPNGIKGMGEGGAVAPGAVLACAIEDAIKPIGEVFVDRTPLTPERVVSFIEAAAGGGAE